MQNIRVAAQRSPAPAIPLLAMTLVAGLVACAPAGETTGNPGDGETAAAATLTAGRRIVDLTHELSPESLYWPTGTPFEFERLSWGPNEQGWWYAAARFATVEHLGTHLDAPIHFHEGGWTNEQIPVQRFLAPAVVIDIAQRAATDPDATLRAEDLVAWEQRNGPIPAGAIVVVRSGWSSRWPDWNTYYGSDNPFDTTTLHFPGVSPEGAAAVIERGAVGVGIDTASIDPGNDLQFRAHKVLSAASLFNLENLTGLEQLPESGATLLALPIKIAGGTGGPTRVVALVPDGS